MQELIPPKFIRAGPVLGIVGETSDSAMSHYGALSPHSPCLWRLGYKG